MKSGKRIVIMGIDGSGKSSIIKRLLDNNREKKFYYVWLRYRPTLLGPLYKILKKKETKIFKKEAGGGSELEKSYQNRSQWKKKLFKNQFVKGIWGGLTFADYLVQYYGSVMGAVFRKENMLMDRSYIDYFVERGINFHHTEEQIWHTIQKNKFWFLKEDRVIYLKVSPEIAYARKEDIPNLEFLEDRYRMYEYIAKKDGWFTVNNEQDMEKTLKTIQGELDQIYKMG